MPLDKPTLKTALENALGIGQLSAGDASTVAAKASLQQVASDMADAIDSFVRSGLVSTVVVTPDTINGTGVGAVT